MKKFYESPELAVHGTVAEITKNFGSSQAEDTVIWGDNPFNIDPGTEFGPGYGGSQDGIIQIVPY